MSKKKSLGCLDLVSEVIQKIMEGLPQITSQDIKVWETSHREETLKLGERDLGELEPETKKLLLLLYNDYDNIIDKKRRSKFSPDKDWRKYQMACLAWEIFWRQAKVEIPEFLINVRPEDLFFYKGFHLAIREEIPENVVAFPCHK